MGHMGNGAHGQWGIRVIGHISNGQWVQGVWGTWAMGHMGHMGNGGNGVQGVWGTWAIGTFLPRSTNPAWILTNIF